MVLKHLFRITINYSRSAPGENKGHFVITYFHAGIIPRIIYRDKL